jgi:hypothetical protein
MSPDGLVGLPRAPGAGCEHNETPPPSGRMTGANSVYKRLLGGHISEEHPGLLTGLHLTSGHARRRRPARSGLVRLYPVFVSCESRDLSRWAVRVLRVSLVFTCRATVAQHTGAAHMIPLHLRTTTIHVTPDEAQRLIAANAATWLPGVRALLTNRASDSDVLAALPEPGLPSDALRPALPA